MPAGVHTNQPTPSNFPFAIRPPSLVFFSCQLLSTLPSVIHLTTFTYSFTVVSTLFLPSLFPRPPNLHIFFHTPPCSPTCVTPSLTTHLLPYFHAILFIGKNGQ